MVWSFLHSQRIHLQRYLDVRLLLASSLEECQAHRKILLDLCIFLGLRISLKKSSLVPAQKITYLGMLLDTVHFWAYPKEKRTLKVQENIHSFSLRDSHLPSGGDNLRLYGIFNRHSHRLSIENETPSISAPTIETERCHAVPEDSPGYGRYEFAPLVSWAEPYRKRHFSLPALPSLFMETNAVVWTTKITR